MSIEKIYRIYRVYKGKTILGIIPARGGSKGLIGKNILPLLGKPLIAWTIEQALKSKHLDKVIVSTDDNEIAEISKNFGADIPFMRPAELAEDDSPTVDAIFHAIDKIKSDLTPDIIVLLQPTSPLRNRSDINDAIELFVNSEYDSVISMCKVKHSPYWYFRYDNDTLKPLLGDKYLKVRRQDLPDIYRPNGAIYITTLNNLYKNNSFYSEKIIPYIMPFERSIDIDEEIDFRLAEISMKIQQKS